VLQDDTVVCRNFVPALDLIAAANPDVPVVLFRGKYPRRTGAAANRLTGRYVDLVSGDFLPVVAVLWPVHVASSFLQWASENTNRLPGGPAARSDDAVGGRWIRFTRQRVRCTLPSLVEHPDDVPSTIRRSSRDRPTLGRVAAHYIGDGDPLELDWS